MQIIRRQLPNRLDDTIALRKIDIKLNRRYLLISHVIISMPTMTDASARKCAAYSVNTGTEFRHLNSRITPDSTTEHC